MSNQVTIEVDDTQVKKQFLKFSAVMPEEIRQGLIESMEYVGLVAVGNYMYARAVVDKATGKVEGRGSITDKLGIVTSVLSRSILDKESEKGKQSIRRVITDGKNLNAEMGSKVPYAAIHEYGGKAGRNKSVTIPARPYLNPALKESQTWIYQMLKTKLELATRKSDV